MFYSQEVIYDTIKYDDLKLNDDTRQMEIKEDRTNNNKKTYEFIIKFNKTKCLEYKKVSDNTKYDNSFIKSLVKFIDRKIDVCSKYDYKIFTSYRDKHLNKLVEIKFDNEAKILNYLTEVEETYYTTYEKKLIDNVKNTCEKYKKKLTDKEILPEDFYFKHRFPYYSTVSVTYEDIKITNTEGELIKIEKRPIDCTFNLDFNSIGNDDNDKKFICTFKFDEFKKEKSKSYYELTIDLNDNDKCINPSLPSPPPPMTGGKKKKRYEDCTIQELKDRCSKRNINIKGLRSKKDIINKLRGNKSS